MDPIEVVDVSDIVPSERDVIEVYVCRFSPCFSRY